MYYGDYQFDWLCAYTVVLLGTSITGYNRLLCTIIMFTGSPSPLMYYGDYQFDWLCAYTVVGR